MNTTELRTSALDMTALRGDFPGLDQKVHGRPLAYLDNAATAQKPRVVLEALRRAYQLDCANVHRGLHELADRATRTFEAAREVVRQFLGAATKKEIVFVSGATGGINLVASSFMRQLREGDEIVVTEMEHHSNIVPWQLLCEQTGAHLRVTRVTNRGELDLESYRQLLGPRTRFVALSHVSNVLGTINPVQELIQQAHALNVPVLLDGAQAVPHLPIDVRELDCDFYVFSSHKVFGPTGIGVLYGKQEYLQGMPPYQGGGEMIRSVSFKQTSYADSPQRFEAGTPHIAGAAGLAAALNYLRGWPAKALRSKEDDLLSYATAALDDVPGLRIYGSAPNKVSVISFTLEGVHAHDLATILDREGVAIRAGHHCAQPLMERYGLSATARASFAFYNTRAEVDALVHGLHKARELFGR